MNTARLAAARQRIETSRARLIHTFYPAHAQAPRASNASASTAPPASDWTSALGADAPWDALRRLALRWWQRQTWHGPVELVAGTVLRQARPLVRRHPWAALAAGAVTGALLVGAGPWLLRGTRRHTAPLRQQLVGSLWATLGSASVQVALASALVAWMERHNRPDTAASSTPSPTPAPPPTPDGAP
ncbi:hypothetical protein [Hydrogenophaga sp. MI9]|uniref:hypothetical protein n=1 Tax=Hydrogenophaga sp. MI9 TaxID=3453719 RepID=UPI003EEEA773